ncbi:pyridoxamine 5'-phosphate oxidase [Nonomuraea fuscirosea]|uniref:pyridoxamine 5'-phosphate oxidase n=1 Tax=Nonomuraea fuscirosea TaxID=1291556 RepID=UPI0015E707FC|nr:pyridoxamine 5'-phosphate oxidase [Nonomuraea fuscirosea]
MALLDTPTAQHLLTAPLVARLAYTGKDGTSRLISVNFLWTGDDMVIGTFAGAYKIRNLRARLEVAITIDATFVPPQVLMLRGMVTLSETEGVLPEYATVHRPFMGEEAGAAYGEAIDQPGLRMVRIGLRPAWVGVLDCQQRFPVLSSQPVLAAYGVERYGRSRVSEAEEIEEGIAGWARSS